MKPYKLGKITQRILLCALCAAVIVGIILAVNQKFSPPGMRWAKSLTVEDVQSVEFIQMPHHYTDEYAKLEPAQFPALVKLINQSRGTYLAQPEAIAGGGQSFYITTTDGKRHLFSNNGNTYLEIDGETYRASYYWLSQWNFSGNAAIPESFFYGYGAPLTLEQLKTIAEKGSGVSWEDFTPYLGYATGSGLYIMRYPITESYYVSVGGVPDQDPMYVNLTYAKTGAYIDIRAEGLDAFIQANADADFTAASMTTHENGVDGVPVQITDSTEIRKLRSLLMSGEPTNRESVNDAPDAAGYLHISFQNSTEMLHSYLYEENGAYYVEQPYNGIWEISIDTLDQLLTMMTEHTNVDAVESPAAVTKQFPPQDDSFTPAVTIAANGSAHTITFQDRLNNQLTLACVLPDGWTLQAPTQGDGLITGKPVEIYADGTPVGSLFYDAFTLYQDENGEIPYRSVYNGIMLGSMASWDNAYTEIRKEETTCVATCKPWRNLSFPGVSNAGAATVYNKGILAYHTGARKYIAIGLDDDAITDTQWLMLAKSVRLQ